MQVTADEVISGNRFLAMCHELGISYAKTDYIGEAVPGAPGVLVTHNGGYNVRAGPQGSYALTTPHNIHNPPGAHFLEVPGHWYCLNADADNELLHGIPLGVDNWEIPAGHEDSKHFTLSPDGSRAGSLVLDRLGQRLPTRGRVYLRLASSTAPYGRGYCMLALQDKPFVTHDAERLEPGDFLDQLLCHEFVACPEGNGIDTHRMWEALYLGCWPIVKRSRAMLEFAGLPIMFVDSWDDVEEWALDAHLGQVVRGAFSMGKATLSYWKVRLCQHF